MGAGRDGVYRVLLPADPRPGERLPVVYFLHDYFGDSGILWRSGAALELQRRMASGALPRLVVIAPDGDHGYWSDVRGGDACESWLLEGLRHEVESRLPVATERRGRAVAGISMGGFGALKAALRRPDLYAAAGSLSGALLPLDADFVRGLSWIARRPLERVFGPAAGANDLARNDLYTLLRTFPAGAPRPDLLLVCGLQDKYHLDQAARRFDAAARAAGFHAELRLEPGGHDWSYWRRSAVDLIGELARRLAPASEVR